MMFMIIVYDVYDNRLWCLWKMFMMFMFESDSKFKETVALFSLLCLSVCLSVWWHLHLSSANPKLRALLCSSSLPIAQSRSPYFASMCCSMLRVWNLLESKRLSESCPASTVSCLFPRTPKFSHMNLIASPLCLQGPEWNLHLKSYTLGHLC